MKRIKFIAAFIIMLSNICFTTSAASLKKEASEKIKVLSQLVSTAKKKGIDVQREDCAIWMAKEFMTFADWDEKNVDQNIYQYSTWQPFKENAERLAKELPDFEREEIVKMLDSAIEELSGVIDGRYSRRAVPKIDWSDIKPCGNQFYSNGRPVFVNDYFTKTDGYMNDYLGCVDRLSLALNVIKGEQGDLSYMGQQRIADKESKYSGYVLLWHGVAPQWIKDKEPNVADGKRLFTQYDIDNPLIRKAWDLTFKASAPVIKEKRIADMGYILANEPHWHSIEKSWATGGISSYTMEKFKKWLQAKHTQISTLNQLWGTSFASFDDLAVTIPISREKLYTPMGYDWQRFNMDRVTDWFSFLDSSLKKYDSDAKTHIKLIPRLFTHEYHDHGLDMESLFEITDIIGNDAKLIKKSYYKKNIEAWENRYVFDWKDMAISYDFFHSVNPNGPNVNSESHFLSSTAYRDIYMTKEFARTTYWLATMFGMNMSYSWFWPREVGGAIREDLRSRRDQVDNAMNNAYVASVVQQPRVANEVAKTYMDINAFGEEIARMQSQRRPIRLFYSETSAINKRNQLSSTFNLYESLFFEGISLGFVTRNIINKQDNNLWDVVLVWDMESVLESEIDALQSYLDRGGVVVIDDKSLKFDEYKRAHTKTLTASNGKLITASTIEEFNAIALQSIDSKELPPITVEENNEIGKDGCVWRVLDMGDSKYLLSISNMGKTDATINVAIKGSEIAYMTEQFLGKKINNGFTINSENTLLIEIKSK